MVETTKVKVTEQRVIPIDDNFRLTFDSMNVIVQRKRVVDPTKSPSFNPEKHDATIREEWTHEGYYSSVPKALSGVLDKRMVVGNATTLYEILAEVKAFRSEINALLTLEGGQYGD